MVIGHVPSSPYSPSIGCAALLGFAVIVLAMALGFMGFVWWVMQPYL